MSSCCCNSDLVGDSFADIIRGIAHLSKTITHEYVNISELSDKSDVFVLYLTVIIVVVILAFTFKLILTWSCNSIGCSGIYSAQGGNTVTAFSSSAEETIGHAPLENLDSRSSTRTCKQNEGQSVLKYN
jgi:hypothetical protein